MQADSLGYEEDILNFANRMKKYSEFFNKVLKINDKITELEISLNEIVDCLQSKEWKKIRNKY